MHLNEEISKIRLDRIFYWLGIAVLTVFILIQFKSFFQPFVLALLLWFLIRDLMNLIGRFKIKGKGLPRWTRGIIAFVTILALIFITSEILIVNVELILNKLPEYEEKLDLLILQMGEITGVENISEWLQKGISELNFRSFLLDIIGNISSMLSNFFVITIYVAFLLAEETSFQKKLYILFSRSGRGHEISDLTQRIAQTIHSYLSVKTLISLLTGLLSYFILIAFGVDFPVFWAFFIFILNYIPYVGSFVATFLPAFFAIFQFNSLMYFAWVFVSIEIVQLFVGNYVEPRVVGNKLNLSPLVILLSLSFWGMIWGVFGMILSVPVTSIVMIVLSQFESTKPFAIILSKSGDGIIHDE